MRLQGKHAIVTGAGSGIGRATARLFAREGAAVLAVDLHEDGLRETAAGAQGRIETLVADVGDEAGVQRFVGAALDLFGGLDVIHANAGVSGGEAPFFETSVALFQEVLRINLIGPFLAIKYGAPHLMAAGGGSIVCTASVAGLRANAAGTPYSASKAGVISLVQSAANALHGTGVRVNAICPGLIETGMTQPLFEAARARGSEGRIGQLNPLLRAGVPEEIAAMALFLASDEASYVNGQAFPVDGGLSSTLPFRHQRR
ncbi:MAG TPA: SDR family NAD(P)-dependent oxidoreductase [Microvirga sp.]